MNTELFDGTLSEAIRVDVRFECLSLIQNVLVPCQTYSLCVFNVGNCENGAHLVSNFDWPLNIENPIRRFSWIAIGGEEAVITGCLCRLHQVVDNALRCGVTREVPQNNTRPAFLT